MPKDLSGQQVGMSPVNDVNNPRPNIPRGYNQFPQSYMHLTTEHYGLYEPFYYAKCERGDVMNLNSEHELHSFTMKSPFVGKLKKTKSYIKVPMQAIYPRNWERMFTIPTQGDDVPADTRALLDVRSLLSTIIEQVNAAFLPSDVFLKQLFLIESICSHGSLFEKFNIHFDYRFNEGSSSLSNVDFDTIFDKVIAPMLISFGVDGGLLRVDGYDNLVAVEGYAGYEGVIKVSPSRWIEILRSGNYELALDWDALEVPEFFGLALISGFDSSTTSPDTDGLERYVNIEPLIAYQLACSQFATNDFVDFIYSAKLYRDNLQSIYLSSQNSLPSFEYNGVDYLYDIFSARILTILIDASAGDVFALNFFLNLFSFVPSLRYGDYFTGGKPQPLAVGEYSAKVNNNEVSAIDITRSIQMQRLLHRVNMVGRKLGDYLSGIFGGKLPEADKDVPIFLAHQNFDVDGFQTNNTGDAQLDPDVNNIITTNLRSTKDKFAFEVTIDEPCYIIGMSSYAMMRVYSKTMDRFVFHHDRYDDFIPEMQYIGDQEIFTSELDCNEATMYPFAYTLRYMEYKQRYSYASGGFINQLPSWAFITDNTDGNVPSRKITPEYIRSVPSEFDRFYKSLTGYSLGTRFHFIVAYTNHTAPLRRMEYTPEILK